MFSYVCQNQRKKKMELGKIKSKIDSVKKLIGELERKSIDIITASAELEYRYRKTVCSKEISYQAVCELLTLEKNIDEILKSSHLIMPKTSEVKESIS